MDVGPFSHVIDGTEIIIKVLPYNLGLILFQNLFAFILDIQPTRVVYKSLDISVFNVKKWDSNKVEAIDISKEYSQRYICGSGLTGNYRGTNDISTKSLSFSMYGKDLPVKNPRPSRFLIQGTYFQNMESILSSPSVASIENHLSKGYNYTVGSQSISLKPLSNSVGYTYEVQIVQLNGLSHTAKKNQ